MARGKIHDELERSGTGASLTSTEAADLAIGSHAALGAAFHLGPVNAARPTRRRFVQERKDRRTKPIE